MYIVLLTCIVLESVGEEKCFRLNSKGRIPVLVRNSAATSAEVTFFLAQTMYTLFSLLAAMMQCCLSMEKSKFGADQHASRHYCGTASQDPRVQAPPARRDTHLPLSSIAGVLFGPVSREAGTDQKQQRGLQTLREKPRRSIIQWLAIVSKLAAQHIRPC